MSNDQFFRGLLAALRLAGREFIDTRKDNHHERFEAAMEFLAKVGGVDMPHPFIPSPFTGTYREFDDALLQMQRGLLGAQNPFYPGIGLTLSPERAKSILEDYSPEQQKVFRDLAAVFIEPDSSTADVEGLRQG